MRISIITLDGGAGKTAIAFALAKDLDYFLISNDDSVIEKAYAGSAKIMKQPKIIDDVVYDFGGFVDTGVLDVIKASDLVIVPCINDLNSKMKAIKTINQLKAHNSNFLVVATRLEGDKDFDEVKEALQNVFSDMPVIALRKTKLFKNALEFGQSPLELEAESKQIAYTQRNILAEYKALLKYVKDGK
ncbi:MAG TPA: hypothetical protein EYG70_00940 [Sulfurimonas sp.]|nr:hypothetical protein [Sulfurimonas sp.]